MSGIFKKFRKDDIEITPFEAHKEYYIHIENSTGSYFEKNYEQHRIIDATPFGAPFIPAFGSTNSPFNPGQYGTAYGTNNIIVSLSVFHYESEFDGSDFEPIEYGSYYSILKPATHAVTTNGFYKRSMHSSIQGMYYTNPDDPCWTLDNNGYEKEIRTLGRSAQILSIPQKIFGERIKKGSVNIRSGSVTIIDDGFGNLINADKYITTPSESISYVSRSLFTMNFDDLYNRHGKKISAHSINALASSSFYRDNGKEYYDLTNKTRFFERSGYPNEVRAHNFIPTTGSITEGTCIQFDGITPITQKDRINHESQSMMLIKHTHQLDLEQSDDYSVFIRISASASQPSSAGDSYQSMMCKVDPIGKAGVPFDIRMDSAVNIGQVSVLVSDGVTTLTLTDASPGYVDITNGFHNILFTKAGNTGTLYINGVLKAQGVIPSGFISNRADISVAARPKDSRTYEFSKDQMYSRRREPVIEYHRHLKCTISQIMIFGRALETGEVTFLESNPGFENKVGNVFYNHGLLVLTSPSLEYTNTTQGDMFSECTLSFKNTHTIIEHEYNAHIKEREYGFTMNPTIVDDTKLGTIKSFVTGSEFSPYVTTIGLYDDHARLLAIGKLSRAIKKSSDYDTTYVVSFDT